jgi:hypothetical protein
MEIERRVVRMVHACRTLIEEQAEEKWEWGGAAQRQTARQQLVRVERMVRQNAHSMERPLEMERRVALLSFGWCKLQMVDRADNISRTRID